MKLVVVLSSSDSGLAERCKAALEEFASISNDGYRQAISGKQIRLFMKVFKTQMPNGLGMTVEGNNVLNMPFEPPSPDQIMELLGGLKRIAGKKADLPDKVDLKWRQKLIDNLSGWLTGKGIIYGRIDARD
jgi:hypothetical protein